MNYKKQRYLNRYVISILLILAMATPTLAAHTLDTSATYQTTSWSTTNPGTLSYTAGSGSTLMILFIQTSVAQRTLGTPTFNGKSFTLLNRTISATPEGASELYYLNLTPSDTGSAYTVSVPNAATSRAMSFQVATFITDGTPALESSLMGSSATTGYSYSQTTASDGSLFVNSRFSDDSNCDTVTSPGISLYNNDGGAFCGGSFYYIKATAGLQTLGITGITTGYSHEAALFKDILPPADTTFTVTIPAGETQMNFTNAPNSSIKYFYPQGQTLGTPYFNISNDGNIDQSFRFYVNSTAINIDLYADTDSVHTSGTSLITTTTTTTIVSNLAPDGYQNVWMFVNYSKPLPATIGKLLTINSSS